MIEHKVNDLNNFICGWYMDDTSICDELIDYHKQNKDKDFGRCTVNGDLIIDKSYKDSIDCGLDGEVSGRYFQKLQLCLDEYIKKYSWCNYYAEWRTIERANIQRYPPNGGFHAWHTERTGGEPPISTRHLVYMTYLNTVTDEGETEFFYQKLKVKPEKGLTIIWPADWTFTHRGVSSPSEEKYIVTGWLNYL
jgi:hypothetical protein